MQPTQSEVTHFFWRLIRVKLCRGLGLSLLITCLFTAPFGIAQSTTAVITGTVTDNTGAILPNATVTLTNLGTRETRIAKTTATGDYTFTLLNPGSYSIKMESPGFKTVVIPSVTLAASDRAREDSKLDIGAKHW